MGLSRRKLLAYLGTGACASAVSGLLPALANAALPATREGLPLYSGQVARYHKIVMLGDSNSTGKGQGKGFGGGVMGKLSRSIINAGEPGFGRNRGYTYATVMSPYQELDKTNAWMATSTKTYQEGVGASGMLARLAAGDWVEISDRKFTTLKFVYDPAQSAGAKWTVAVDGKVIAAGSTDASGSTGDIEAYATVAQISRESRVRFTCVEGNIGYQDVELLDSHKTGAPLLWCAAEGSQGFSDFATQQRLASIVPQVNARTGNTLLCTLLGTNNLVGTVGKQLTPDAYADALQACLNTWSAALGAPLQHLVVVPPKPRLVLPLGRYEDYVQATVQRVGGRQDLSLVRTDLSVLGSDATEGLYDPDGLHLNAAGHQAWAEVVCQHLNITLQDFQPGLPV